MKKLFIIKLLFSFLIGASVFAQTKTRKILIGKWIGTDNGKTGSFEFIDSTHVKVIYPNGTYTNGVYEINFTKEPIWFDIINIQRGHRATLKGLIKFIDDNTLK